MSTKSGQNLIVLGFQVTVVHAKITINRQILIYDDLLSMSDLIYILHSIYSFMC